MLSCARAAAPSRGFTRLLDAVVNVEVREIAFEAGGKRFSASIGSGVILTDDGVILTNAHVVSPRAVEVNVTLANLERVNARLVGWDHWTDLAVLRLDMADVKRRHLSFSRAEFGDSDKLVPGETVYAVGTPHGLARTVTRGIISNNNRYLQDNRGVRGYETGAFNTWLQTDAAINPGNSGGPLVTEDGRVIGINSRGYLGADNLAFAIPASTAKRVLAALLRDGAITRSYIGLVPAPLRDLEGFYALQLNTGVLVNSVDVGSPAARAGLRGGDILLAINGRPVDGRFPEQLPAIQDLIASEPLGAKVTLRIKRGAETRDYPIATEKLESRVGEEWAFERWGVSVRKVSRTFARENQLADDNGVLVIGVQPGFPADVAGIQRGDIIAKVNQQVITDLEVMKTQHAAFAAHPEPTLVEVRRGRQVFLFILKP
ncbi:trypsin-like peptidase domain-containing protein [Horticoccus luteus]|uniref:Trypsin-like peptidase domain-containing protein n=2 Tax=Horticoccus luteus TaxID=2862869 RepID=A0A8F9TZM1_9BACT|nr:trypsin-like peptidase domain-containing protein [Horticoccus luteus]